MFREINAAQMNNVGARQFSQSPLTIKNLPDRNTPLSSMEEFRGGTDTQRKVGVNTDPQNLKRGNLVDLNA